MPSGNTDNTRGVIQGCESKLYVGGGGRVLSPLVSRVFQRVNDLPPTGELDEATLGVMRQPRCGLEDPFNKKFHKYRVMGESQSPSIGG